MRAVPFEQCVFIENIDVGPIEFKNHPKSKTAMPELGKSETEI